MRHEGAPVARDAVDRAEQLSHAGHDRNLRPLARSQQVLIVRAQPGVFPDGEQCRHPEPMAQACVSEREIPRTGERALARLPQTRHHTDVASERGGVAKAARD